MDPEELWTEYRDARPEGAVPERYDDAVAFGDDPETADLLADLVVGGEKTGTAAALWACEAGERRFPEVGDLCVVLDGDGTARCVVETVAVEVTPFDEVGEAAVSAEGDGIATVEDWREVHWEYWSRTLPAIGRAPAADMPVVTERFEVAYVPSGE
jgi:uncharacterized protein YhfF